MKACLNVYAGEDSPRRIWLADTFPEFQRVSPPPFPIRFLLCALIRATMWMPLKYKRKAITTAFQDNFPEEEYTEETIDHFLKNLYRHNADPKPPVRDDLDDVQEAFRRYDLLDDRIEFLKGWFAETLPVAPIEQLALLRLDADFYRSTMDGLQLTYHKLAPGGFCIIDDYGAFPECRRAVDEFRETHSITEAIEQVDGECIVWKKERDNRPLETQ
ncbi:MAG: hypothetical protein GY801_47785 [bacterium]|nr:hypothetical protein [bacterium]